MTLTAGYNAEAIVSLNGGWYPDPHSSTPLWLHMSRTRQSHLKPEPSASPPRKAKHAIAAVKAPNAGLASTSAQRRGPGVCRVSRSRRRSAEHLSNLIPPACSLGPHHLARWVFGRDAADGHPPVFQGDELRVFDGRPCERKGVTLVLQQPSIEG